MHAGRKALTTLPPVNLLYLWDRRTLFVGALAETLGFSQAAASFTVSLDGPLRVSTPELPQPVLCHSLLMAAGQSAVVEVRDSVIAACYLDPFGVDYAALVPPMEHLQPGLYIRHPDQAHHQAIFRDLLGSLATADVAYATLEKLFAHPNPGEVQIDPRVAKVVQLIKDSVAENRPVETLAQQVNLSVPRLAELFRQQIGIPIRRYRQWHRLYVTAIDVAQGRTITDAAIAAGFTDSSHFTHTFRTMLGVKPSVILSQLDRVRVIIPASRDLNAAR